MTPKQAQAKIEKLLAEADVKLAEAAAVAEKAKLAFYYRCPFDTGGQYIPEGSDVWLQRREDELETYTGWVSSSADC